MVQAFEIVFLRFTRNAGFFRIGKHTVTLGRVEKLDVDHHQCNMVLYQRFLDRGGVDDGLAIGLLERVDVQVVLVKTLQIGFFDVTHARHLQC